VALKARTDHALGAAAANVDHEATLVAISQVLCDAEVDQSSLFAAGQDLDLGTERLRREPQEDATVAYATERGGTNRADSMLGHKLESLTEALEGVKGAGLDHRVEPTADLETLGQRHAFAQLIDNVGASVYLPGHHKMKRVRPEIDRGEALLVEIWSAQGKPLGQERAESVNALKGSAGV
jgi:hypothetical protein